MPSITESYSTNGRTCVTIRPTVRSSSSSKDRPLRVLLPLSPPPPRVRHRLAGDLSVMTPLVWFRALRPDDGALLEQVMDGMSPQSRYQRYHGPKPRLTSSDRRYLTNVDARDHLALVALAPEGAPIAIVRAVRLQDDLRAAELGIEVVDAWQSQGIGTTLIARIARRAAGAGVERPGAGARPARVVARVLAESGFARSLMRRGWSVIGGEGPSIILGADAWAIARADHASRP